MSIFPSPLFFWVFVDEKEVRKVALDEKKQEIQILECWLDWITKKNHKAKNKTKKFKKYAYARKK